MIKVDSVPDMRELSRRFRHEGRTIGFVPTMGYLHEGHMELLRASVEQCDATVLSIFVNPTQFAPGEDLEEYPRDMDRDLEMARSAGVDVVFTPSNEQMYPEGFSTYIDMEGLLTRRLCGKRRPGHFRGVMTVVAKLFNIVGPHRAYFGQKDYQQTVVIRRMTEELNLGVDITVLPTVREDDGLAVSSRNSYLTEEQRRRAGALYKALKAAGDKLRVGGEVSSEKVEEEIAQEILNAGFESIDYVNVADPRTLESLEMTRLPCVILAACRLGRARLIDNITVEKKDTQ